MVPGLALALSLAPVSAQSSPSPATSASPAAAAAGNAANGATLFGQNCASCHGASAEGGVGPKLNPIEKCGNVAKPLDPAYLTDVITNGLQGVHCTTATGNQMPAKGGGNLSDKDVQDLVAFILQQNSSKTKVIGPAELARANVEWVTIGILVMLVLTWLLARYNMRWIDRRAAARRERLARQERG